MKKIILTSSVVLLLAAIIILVLSSSFKDKEPRYSCDPNIEDWVIKNKEKFKKITLTSFNSYPTNQRLAIYRSLEPKKRESLWLEKFDNIINLKDGWSESEIKYIKRLRDFIITSKIFYEVHIDKYIPYLKNWIDSGVANFNWSRWDVFYLSYSLYSTSKERKEIRIIFENEFRENEKKRLEGLSKKSMSFNSEALTCTCNTTVNDCGDLGFKCEYDMCNITSGGCGVMKLQSCNGRCFPN